MPPIDPSSSAAPRPAEDPAPPIVAAAEPAPPPRPEHRSADVGSLLGLAIAALVCLGLGWLAYQLVSSLGRSPSLQPPEEALSPPPVTRRAVPAPTALPPAAGLSGSVSSDSLALLRCSVDGYPEQAAPADPSNYGRRLAVDWQGRPVPNTPVLIVLHETVVDEPTALALFRRRHSDDGQQASYHVLIGRDGRRLRVVPDAERAFGAGDSEFAGMAVQLKQGLRPSVNNIALHVSLVTPPDGSDGEAGGHSGYTPEQYRSLATQIAQWQASYGIPASQVVTHQEVDRSGSRRDPRALDWATLGRDLRSRWLACGGSVPIASRMAALRQGLAPASR